MLKHWSTLIERFEQVHSLDPEQDTNLEEFRNVGTKTIGIDQLGRGQVVSPVAGRVPQNTTDIFVNSLRECLDVIVVEQER